MTLLEEEYISLNDTYNELFESIEEKDETIVEDRIARNQLQTEKIECEGNLEDLTKDYDELETTSINLTLNNTGLLT